VFSWDIGGGVFNRALGDGNGQVQIFGNSGFAAQGSNATSYDIGGTNTLVWGSTYFNPTTLVLQDPLCNASTTVTLADGIDLNGADRTISVNKDTGAANLTGAISTSSGTAGITKTGVGTLILSNTANTFNGQLTVARGALSIASINNASANGVLGNSALSVILGASGQTGKLLYTGGTTSSTKPFTMATGGTGAFDVSTAATILTLSGQIDGDGAMSKVGAGTLALTGANTYTGATTINAGTLAVNSPGSLAAGSAVTVTNATLNGSGTVNGTVTINNGGTVTGGGMYNGTVTVNSGGTLSGAVNITAAVTATNAYISPAGQGTIGSLTMGSGLTLNGGNGMVCDLGTVDGSSDTNAITGDLVLYGTNFVVISVPTGSAAANATYTIMTFTGSQTGTGSLVFPNGTATMNGATLNINANSVTITTGSGGITTGSRDVIWKGTSSYVWDSSTVNWEVGGTPTAYAYGDNVTFGTNGVAASPITGMPANPGSVTVNSASGKDYTIAASIGGSGGLTKSGTSTLGLSGINTFTGPIVLAGGTLDNASASTLGSAGDITFTGSATLRPQRDISPVLNKSLTINGGVTGKVQLVSQFYNMTVTGPLAGSGTLYVQGDAGGAGGSVSFPNAANTFMGPIQFNVQGNGPSVLTVNSLPDVAQPIAFGGTQPAVAGGSFVLGAGAATPLLFNNRWFEFSGNGVAPGGVINNNNATRGNTIEINKGLRIGGTGNKALTLGGSNTGNNIFAGVITNGTSAVISLSKADAGTWILSGTNTFTGPVTISGGILSISAIDVVANSNPLGMSANTAGNLILNAGRLRYTGAAASTDRLFSLQVSSTLDASGTGAVNFTNTGSMGFNGGTTAKTLTLTGTNAGSNTLAAVIGNNTGATSLTKDSIGTWVLSGANTHTGATILQGGGTLVMDYSTQNNSKIASAAALTLGSTTLGLGGGTLTLTGGSFTQSVVSATLNPGGTFITRSGGTSTLNLNALTAGGGAARGGSLSFSTNDIATTDNTNLNGILGGFAVVGSDWAVNSTDAADGSIIALASYTALPQTGSLGTINYSLTGEQTQTGVTAVNSLKIIASADNQTFAIGANSVSPTTRSNASGVLFTAEGNGYTYNITGTTGVIGPATGNNDIFLFVNDGTLNVTALVGSGSGYVVKAGSGTLILGANNPYSGYTFVNQGTLRLTHANGAGTTGAIYVQNMAALELSNGITVGAKNLTITGAGVSNGGALRNIAGNASTYRGAITIGTGGARINSDAGGSLSLTNTLATSYLNDATIGGAGNTTISGVISGAGNLIKDGSGTLTLSGASANTLSGETRVNSGTLLIESTAVNAIADTSTLRIASGARLEIADRVTETVGVLYLGGQPASPGTWGSNQSTADNRDSVYFTGTGEITVTQLGSGTPYEAQGPAGTVLIVK